MKAGVHKRNGLPISSDSRKTVAGFLCGGIYPEPAEGLAAYKSRNILFRYELPALHFITLD